MDSLLSTLESSTLATMLRGARWGYAVVNATHILGIALLVGAILPLNLRLLGLWPTVVMRDLARVLVPVAAIGLGLSILAGMTLFSVRASEYAALGVLQAKLGLVVTGAMAALWAHLRHGIWLDQGEQIRMRLHAILSLTCWLAALVLGRLIAFVS